MMRRTDRNWLDAVNGIRLVMTSSGTSFRQFQNNLDEVRFQTKMKKITFALSDYKRAHYFPENRAAHLLLNRENHVGMKYDHAYQTKPPSDERMAT